MVKFLVTDHIAGKIIGNSGDTINQLMEDSNSIIRLSATSRYYPGTTRRIVSISSDTSEAVIAGLTLVLKEVNRVIFLC